MTRRHGGLPKRPLRLSAPRDFPLPRPRSPARGTLRVNNDVVYERSEVADQRATVVLRAGLSGHRIGEFIDGLDGAAQGRRMQYDLDGRLFKDDRFCLNARSLFLSARRSVARRYPRKSRA